MKQFANDTSVTTTKVRVKEHGRSLTLFEIDGG